MPRELELFVEDLESLPEGLRDLYVEKQDANGDSEGFKLNVKGVAPSSKVDNFRKENIRLKRELEAFGTNTPEKFQELNERIQTLTDELENTRTKGDKDVEAAVKPLKDAWNAKEAALTEERDGLVRRIEEMAIDNEAARLAVVAGAIPSAVSDIVHRVKKSFRMKDGKPVPHDENGQLLLDDDTAEAFTIEGFLKKRLVKEAPFLFKKDSGSGAPADSSSGSNNRTDNNPFLKETVNLTEQSRVIQRDPKTAEKMMREAKFSDADISEVLRRR